MVLVKPATVIQWHRKGFRLYWRWRSRSGHSGRPKTSRETRDLIRKMSIANPLWGAHRIHGELLKLGIVVSQATVGRYMPWRPAVPSPTWRSFLRNHMGDSGHRHVRCCDRDVSAALHRDRPRPRPPKDHSLRCHPEPDPSLARTSNNRGLPVGYGTLVPAARSGSVIWPGFSRSHLYDGYQGGCYCGASRRGRTPTSKASLVRSAVNVWITSSSSMSIICAACCRLTFTITQNENASLARQGLSGEPTDTPFPEVGPPSSLRTTFGLTFRGGCTAATVPVSKAVPFHNCALRMRCCP